VKRHLSYLKYVLLHKWYVWQAGLVTGAPLWRLLIHDWTKFRPSEWKDYAPNFYRLDGSSQERDDRPEAVKGPFRKALQRHYKRNKHHWQYWVYFRPDTRELKALEMPEKFVREMIADWMGAGKATTGDWDSIEEWYPKNKDKMILHDATRLKVEEILVYELDYTEIVAN